MDQVFILSPAHSGGLRAGMLARREANFELARRVQIGDATLGEVFSFCSGLYFRGKLAYARRFARTALDFTGVFVITPTRGFLPADTPIGLDTLKEFSSVPVDAGEAQFTEPLTRSAAMLADTGCTVVLLGSIATGKYVEPLVPLLNEQLMFPKEFIGRGDMSRGALMLRCAASGEELEYISVVGAVRRGRRAPRLSDVRRSPR